MVNAEATQPAEGASPRSPRPNVLALPLPTTTRFVLLIVALLSAGAIVGNYVHTEIAGDAWIADIGRCTQEAATQTADLSGTEALIEQNAANQRCRAASEVVRVSYVMGGVVVAGMLALACLAITPPLFERRRSLRPLDPTLPAARHLASLVRADSRVSATAMSGPIARLRDAVSYGTPGRYRVALPRALTVAGPDLTDAVLRHELAHIAHRDVLYAWLARSMLVTMLPLLAVPVLLGVVTGDVSLIPDLVWRSAILLVVAELISRALLRSREHDADLRAADDGGGVQAVAHALRRTRHDDGGMWHRGLLARHPTPQERLEVVESPERAAATTWLDAFTAAFLAALIIPIVNSVFAALLGTVNRSDLAWMVAALATGPLLGGSVGLGLWRSATVMRSVHQRVRVAPVALSVGAGLVVGQIVTLGRLAEGLSGGYDRPWVMGLVAVAGVGATTLSASLAEISVDAAPSWRTPRIAAVSVVVVSSLLFSTTLWMTQTIPSSFDFAGWGLVSAFLITELASPLVLVTVAGASAFVAWSLHSRPTDARTPPWLVADGDAATWVGPHRSFLRSSLLHGLAVGIAVGLVIVAHRLPGPIVTDEALQFERYVTDQWMIAAAGLAALLSLLLTAPRRGAGLGLLAGPVAVVTAAFASIAVAGARGGEMSLTLVFAVPRGPLALALLLALLSAPIALVRWPSSRPVPITLGRVATATLGVGLALAVVAVRGVLSDIPVVDPVPQPPAETAAPITDPSADDAADALRLLETERYLDDIALPLLRERTEIEQRIAALAAVTGTPEDMAARVNRELAEPTRTLHEEMRTAAVSNPAIATLHDESVTALDLMATAFELLAQSVVTGDEQVAQSAGDSLTASRLAWARWDAGLQALTDETSVGGDLQTQDDSYAAATPLDGIVDADADGSVAEPVAGLDDPPAPEDACPLPGAPVDAYIAMDAVTDRHRVIVCEDSDGIAWYHGHLLDDPAQAITLPAQQVEPGVYIATNEGYRYIVGPTRLIVEDSSGVVLDQPFVTP